MPSKKRFFGGLVGANPLRSGSFQDPGAVDRVSSNEGVLSIDTAGPEKATSSTTTVTLPDYTTYSETQFTASNAEANDRLMSCAISGDGTITVFGAPFEDGATNTLSGSGAVYVFENGTQVAILRASDAAVNAYFGVDVAISKDGSTIAVGATGRAGATYFGDGAVYVYEKPTNGWANTSSEDARLTHTSADDSENLGQGVAISDNGDTIVAVRDGGSSGTVQSYVHVYEKPTNGWANTSSSAVLSATNSQYSDDFGSGLAISGDGSVIAIGAEREDTTQTNSGTVYVYERPTNGWATSTEDHFLGAPTRTFGAYFGSSCSLNEDGTVLVVGEQYYSSTGRVHVLEYSGSSWSHSAVLTGSSGRTGANVAISRDGTTVTASNPAYNSDEGAAYIWIKPSSGWANSSYHRLITAANGAAGDKLGETEAYNSVNPLAITSDGGKVLAVAPRDDDGGTDSGSGFLFAATTTVPSTTTTTTATQTTQWFWGGLRGRDAIVAGSEVGDDKSLRFDGSGDYLTFTQGTPTSGNTWTFSAWLKKNVDGTEMQLLSAGTSSNHDSITMTASNDLRIRSRRSGSYVVRVYVSPTTTVADGWTHFVVSAQPSGITVWLNGTNPTLSTNDNPTSHSWSYFNDLNEILYISKSAWSSADYVDGQMAEVHFIDGTAYDASYFGETRGGVWLPKEITDVTYGNNGFYLDFAGNDTGVTLLLDGDGTNGQTTFTDKSSASHTITTYGNTQVDTSVKKFGTGSIKFDGNGDYLDLGNVDVLDIAGGDWTIEAWVRPQEFANWQIIAGYSGGGGGTWNGTTGFEWLFLYGATTCGINYHSGTTGVPTQVVGTHNMTLDTWHHLAASLEGTTLRVFVDGSQVASLTNASPVTTTSPTATNIGRGDSGTPLYLEGYIDDLRITRGVARYTGSFTPPTSALTNTPEYLGDFGVDRTTNSNDFSVEGNITPDDQLLDTPNLRFASFDPTSKGTYAILSEGNLKITNNNSSWGSAKTDFAIPAGDKVYFEVMMNGLYGMFGVTKSDSAKNSYLGAQVDGWALYPVTGKNELFHDTNNSTQWGTSSAGGPSNRVFMCAVDRSAGKIYFGAEGKWFTGDETEVSSFASAIAGFTDTDLSSGSLFPAISVNNSSSVAGTLNFGQDHTFAGQKGTLLTPYSDANGVGEFYYQPPPDFLALADNYVVTDSLATTGVLSVSEMLQASL